MCVVVNANSQWLCATYVHVLHMPKEHAPHTVTVLDLIYEAAFNEVDYYVKNMCIVHAYTYLDQFCIIK